MKAWLLLLAATVGAQTPAVSGDAELRGVIGGKPLVIRTTSRLAGAIDSVKWDGVEFIDSHDHGRQLQSAISADVNGVFHVECYNPTEAGSVVDALGPKSTSRLEALSVHDGALRTRTRMAFWLAPGMSSHGHVAQNTKSLSDFVHTKVVRIGRPGMDHVLDYFVQFSVPNDRPHQYLQVEALTGYMPSAFSEELRFDAKTATLVPLPRQNGEQPDPVVLSTPSGSHAMGVFTTTRSSSLNPAPGYGRFKFEHEQVVKWNCVIRTRPDSPMHTHHAYQLYVVIGTREDCRRTLAALTQEFAAR
ncbi:MAG: hypothetical protein RLZZ322_506 [Verrucomicrobiota bacterium]|jgi:hypothetical protein